MRFSLSQWIFIAVLFPFSAFASLPEELRMPYEKPITQIVIKFAEGTYIMGANEYIAEIESGAQASLLEQDLFVSDWVLNPEKYPSPPGGGSPLAQIAQDLETINSLIIDSGLSPYRSMGDIPRANINQYRQNASENTGETYNDLNLYYDLSLPEGAIYGEYEQLVSQLYDLVSVETAYAMQPVAPHQHQIFSHNRHI